MISYVNILRSLAIIGVVVIHATGPLMSRVDNMPFWWLGNLVDGAVRWCIPIFVMISGMLLLNPKKQESISVFMKKRASKILIPFVFWVVFYTLWKLRRSLGDFSVVSEARNIIGGDVYFHLWYLYMIVGLYLITPVIRVVITHAQQRLIEYYLIIWFITSSLFPMASHFLDLNVGLKLEVFTGYLGYFILGYYLHNIQISDKAKKWMYLAGFIGLIVTFLGTYLGTEAKGAFDAYFFEYKSPNTFFVSVALFIWVKNIDWDKHFSKDGTFMRVVAALSATSFGIYLIHPFVMSLLGTELKNLVGFKINYAFIHPIIGVPVSIVAILLLSFLMVWIMRRIPIIKKLVP